MSNNSLLTVSLKGASQNQPWIVVNATSVEELLGVLQDLNEHDVHQVVADTNANFQAVANVANPSGRAPAPTTPTAGSGEPAQGGQAETPAPARQRGGNSGGSAYGRKKAAAGSGGRGGKKPKLSYEDASADCKHGERRRFAKDDWVAYFCPAPKGDPDACEAHFLDAADDQEG